MLDGKSQGYWVKAYTSRRGRFVKKRGDKLAASKKANYLYGIELLGKKKVLGRELLQRKTGYRKKNNGF